MEFWKRVCRLNGRAKKPGSFFAITFMFTVDFSRTREQCTWRVCSRPGNSRGDLPRRGCAREPHEDEGQRPTAAHLSGKMSVQEEERQGRSVTRERERERERGAYPTGNEARATRRKCRGKRLRRALGSIRDAQPSTQHLSRHGTASRAESGASGFKLACARRTDRPGCILTVQGPFSSIVRPTRHSRE
ncbi:uncharacterized protein LOC143209669 [Lasioglossum baleicum]|uniref:uncharacterized protein LOC143209669 n=1 Tax=Lasioglossum baleicum TaxID=434251 RepID=UPI003FCD888D